MEIQIENACRVCLQESTELEAISNCRIDSLPVLEAMKKLLDIGPQSILTQESPALPNKICQECIEIMSKQMELNKVAKATETYLESHLLGYLFSSHEIFVKSEAAEVKNEQNEQDEQDDDTDMQLGAVESADEVELKIELESADEEPVLDEAEKKKKHQCPTCLKRFPKVSFETVFEFSS